MTLSSVRWRLTLSLQKWSHGCPAGHLKRSMLSGKMLWRRSSALLLLFALPGCLRSGCHLPIVLCDRLGPFPSPPVFLCDLHYVWLFCVQAACEANGPLLVHLAKQVCYHDQDCVYLLQKGCPLVGLLPCAGNGTPIDDPVNGKSQTCELVAERLERNKVTCLVPLCTRCAVVFSFRHCFLR